MSTETASPLLARLRDPAPDAPPARLAALLVDEVLARPVQELVKPERVVKALRDGIVAFTSSDAAVAKVKGEVELVRGLVGMQGAAIGDRVSKPLKDGIRKFATLPFSTRREVVLKLLDRPSFRAVVKAQLTQTLADFGRKAASPVSDNAIARGLGGLGKLAGRVAAPSPLGALASAVSGEVERQLEKRASEFADNAVTGVLASIADQVSDPARAEQQAALRVELLEGLLGLTGADIAQVASASVETQVAIVREALAGWAAHADFERDVSVPLSWWLAKEGDRPLGALLHDLSILETVKKHARELVLENMLRFTAGGAFEAWLAALVP